MPTNLNAQEIAKGMMDKTRTVPVTDSEKRARALREQLDKAQKENRPPVDALEESRRNQDALDRAKSDKVLDQSFDKTSSEITSSSGFIGPLNGAARESMARGARDLAETYLSPSGYAALAPTQKDAVRSQLKDVINGEVGGPDLLAQYATPARLNTFLDRWATDPDFREVVRDLKREIINNPPNTAEIQDRIKASEQAVADKQKEMDGVDMRLAEFSVLHGPIRTRRGGMVNKGEKLQEMEDAERKMKDPAIKAAYDTDMAVLEAIMGKYGIKYLGNGQTDITPQIQKAMGGKGREARELYVLASRLKNSEFETAQRTFDSLTEEHAQLEANRKRLGEELAAENATLATVKNERAQTEQDYADRLTHIPGEAMRRYLDERKGLLPEAIGKFNEAEGAGDEALNNAVSSDAVKKYFTTERFNAQKGEMETVANEVRVREALTILNETGPQFALRVINPATGIEWIQTEIDAELAVNPNAFDHLPAFAPEFVMRTMIESQVNPVTGINFTPAEINDRIARDPDFVKNNQGPMIAEVVKQGVKLRAIDIKNQAQMDAIANNPVWGGMNLLRNLVSDEEIKKRLEGSENGKKVLDYIKKEKAFKIGIGGLLAIALFTGAAGPLALAVAAIIGKPMVEKMAAKKKAEGEDDH